MLALEDSDAELERIASLARERTLEEHTATRRVEELERARGAAAGSQRRSERFPEWSSQGQGDVGHRAGRR